MSSIMTNPSAMTALQSLEAINKSLETTQSRISTGYRVADAKDNAAYWSVATTMRSDNKALSAVQDSLGLGASRVDVAYTAVNDVIKFVDEIKQRLVNAIGQSDANKAKIQADISQYQKQMLSTATSASFSGVNWLYVNSATHTVPGVHDGAEIISAFSRTSGGGVTLGTIDIDVQSIKLFDSASSTNETQGILQGLRLGTTGLRDDTAVAPATPAGAVAATDGYAVTTLTVVGFTDAHIEQMLSVVDATLAELTDAATVIGAAKKRVDIQKEFTTNLIDSIDRGVGQLVDADMSRESTRLQALQVQQQLGIQSLSIANANAQNILSLFRN